MVVERGAECLEVEASGVPGGVEVEAGERCPGGRGRKRLCPGWPTRVARSDRRTCFPQRVLARRANSAVLRCWCVPGVVSLRPFASAEGRRIRPHSPLRCADWSAQEWSVLKRSLEVKGRSSRIRVSLRRGESGVSGGSPWVPSGRVSEARVSEVWVLEAVWFFQANGQRDGEEGS